MLAVRKSAGPLWVKSGCGGQAANCPVYLEERTQRRPQEGQLRARSRPRKAAKPLNAWQGPSDIALPVRWPAFLEAIIERHANSGPIPSRLCTDDSLRPCCSSGSDCRAAVWHIVWWSEMLFWIVPQGISASQCIYRGRDFVCLEE
jgi:hypothetical protein